MEGEIRVGEERLEVFAFYGVGDREGAEGGDGGVEIEEFDETAADGGFGAGGGDEEGCAAGAFEERVFVPPAAFAEMIAVVADEDDDGFVPEVETVHGVHEAADLGVGLGDPGVVMCEEVHAVLVVEAVEGGFEGTAAEGVFVEGRGVGGVAVEGERACGELGDVFF